jgi:hypothetical protein
MTADTTMAGDTMNPPVSNTVVGDPATRSRRFAEEIIASMKAVAMAVRLRDLSDPRPLPARCRLFRRTQVLAPQDQVPGARDQITVVNDKIEVRVTVKTIFFYSSHLSPTGLC